MSSISLWATVPKDDSKLTSIEKGELSEGQMRVREELGLDKDGKDDEAKNGDGASSSDDEGPQAAKPAGRKVEEEEDDTVYTQGMRARDDPPKAGKTIPTEAATSKFHGKSMFDYQGRSFIEPPRGLRPDDDVKCFIPKKCIHKWVGHNGAVNVRGRPPSRARRCSHPCPAAHTTAPSTTPTQVQERHRITTSFGAVSNLAKERVSAIGRRGQAPVLAVSQPVAATQSPSTPTHASPSPRICTLALLTTVAIGVLAFPPVYRVFPEVWPLAAFWQRGHEGQAVGRVQPPQRQAHILWSRRGGSPCKLQRRRLSVPQQQLGPSREALGHGDRQVHPLVHLWQGAVPVQVPARRQQQFPVGMLEQGGRPVRHPRAQAGVHVRLPPRCGQHHYVRRGGRASLHHIFGTRCAACLGPSSLLLVYSPPAVCLDSQDDKKVLVWEWNTNVPVKWISEPTMHSMPAVTMHPSGKYFAGQSMDNNINVFGVKNNFRPAKKKFTGHNVAGYACQIGFSIDGQYVTGWCGLHAHAAHA